MAYGKKVLDHYENPRNVGHGLKMISQLVQVWSERQLAVM